MDELTLRQMLAQALKNQQNGGVVSPDENARLAFMQKMNPSANYSVLNPPPQNLDPRIVNGLQPSPESIQAQHEMQQVLPQGSQLQSGMPLVQPGQKLTPDQLRRLWLQGR